MIDRIIEISETAARLKIQNSLLHVWVDEKTQTAVPLSEIAVLLLSNPAGSLTNAVLSQLAEHGTMVVVVGNDYQPSAMLMPLKTVSRQSERFQKQIQVKNTINKQIWKDIIIQKIINQGHFLEFLYKNDYNLLKLAQTVKSDDSENMEGRTAKIYWKNLKLFAKRDRNNENDANPLLNYGYMVLYACCARAICCVGLHPTIGIHHHNQFNTFCLASDIMEPYRILVDRIVCACSYNIEEVNKESKQFIISNLLNSKVLINGKREQLFNALTITADSLARIYCRNNYDEKILLPTLIYT